MKAKIKGYLWDFWVRNYSNLLHLIGVANNLKKSSIRRILIYHNIAHNCRQNFRKQIGYYTKNYKVVPLSEFIGILNKNDQNYDNVLSITFDDAFKSVYTNAADILDEYSIKACIFVPTGFIETAENHRFIKDNIKSLVSDEPMDWVQLKNLVRRGYEIGSHSFNHVDCGKVDVNYSFELGQSKSILEEKLGCRVEYFAFPFGKKVNISARTIEEIKSYGYQRSFSGEKENISNNNFLLPRTYINPQWDERVLMCILSGIFDW